MPLAPADLSLLAGSRPFAGIPPDVLRSVIGATAVRDVASGERVVAAGEAHRRLHVVLRGELGVYADEGARLALSKVGPGDCVGEQAVLDHGPASALVVATQPSRLATLEAGLLWQAMGHAPAIALNLLRLLSERIRQDSATLRTGFDRPIALEAGSSTDSLTGLHNRRWMEDVFEREILRCARAGKPASLLLIDLDRFGEVNESLGHRIGDAVLARFGELLRRALRPRDLCARFAGTRFAVLLPEIGARRALQAAERLRARVDAQPAQVSREIQVGWSVSIGVAEWEADSELGALLESAGAALADAKRAGRNRVELASVRPAKNAA